MPDHVIAQWDLAAEAYAAFSAASPQSRFCREFISALFDGMEGKSVLDLGCGHGEYTELFRQKKAHALGCDASDGMLALAGQTYPHCTFQKADLREQLPYKGGQFDLVFCNLVLMDVDPLELLVREVYRILKPHGRFFFSIVHPSFYPADWIQGADGTASRNVSAYLTPYVKRQDFCGGTTHYHRPLCYYFNLMADKGLFLAKLYEPRIDRENKNPDIPLYLFADYRK